jgi:hypothetical protein
MRTRRPVCPSPFVNPWASVSTARIQLMQRPNLVFALAGKRMSRATAQPRMALGHLPATVSVVGEARRLVLQPSEVH